MRSRWEALHAGLMKSIENREAAERFEGLRARCEVLARFAAPVSVVGYLAHDGGDLDEKDRILGCLIDEVRHGVARGLAHSLLLLCLWPGLDAAFMRRQRLFQDRPHDLEAELVGNFATQILRLDLDRVRRIAATLVRNTEREAVASRIRELAIAARSVEVSPEIAVVAPLEPPASLFGPVSDRSERGSIDALRVWLERAVGRDAELVVEIVIQGRDWGELAAALGISRKTLNRRVERALVRARGALDVDSLSPTSAEFAFART